MCLLRHLKTIALALVLVWSACLVPMHGAQAQTSQQAAAPDYQTWRAFAERAETLIDQRFTPDEDLVTLRGELVGFRSQFLAAQDANSTRIATLREQIAALGPPPEEGATEAEEVASRRAELNEQLAQLQAPGIAAQEAFRRADGLVRQIDHIMRERQAEALLTLWPSPLNPVNWVSAADAVWGTAFTFGTQVTGALQDPAYLREFRSNLPIVGLLFLVAGFVLMRGRAWIERLVGRWLDEGADRKSKRVLAQIMSLTQIIVPVAAVVALGTALVLTSLTGEIGAALASALVQAGIGYFTARWAGRQLFPVHESRRAPLQLPAPRRREGRFMANLAGLFMGLNVIISTVFDPARQSDAANAVIAFPLMVLAGVVLFRLGALLSMHFRLAAADGGETRFFDRIVGVFGKLAMIIGIGAPLIAAVGYVQAAQALLYPSLVSLGLITGLVFLTQLVDDTYDIVTNRGPDDPDALVPALIGFGLVLLSLPVFAIIWGVRPTQLLEVWQVLREGFSIGETRISPTNLLSFFVIFSIGYLATRMVQGALDSTVLPKTKIDKGGQKAIISGTGYVGILLAALVAISTAGINLSGLAIVAGALSVGIGFGLQNIVSNFISGLILLIERPVAEGDWIEVGDTMGTVRTISVRSTVIETFDRTDVIVPNADLISGKVTNWTRYNSLGRIIIPVGVAYGSDTRKVARILKEIGDGEPLALLDPEPQVHFVDFGADSLDFELRLVLSDVGFGLSVRTELRHQIAERFKEEGIEIPFAQRDIWLRNPEALRGEPAPLAKVEPRDPRDENARTKMRYDEITETDAGSGDADGGR
ncbi:small-conductance mechanosensitive channel [Roseinatronobacter thiooxidans]|uniref:Small-conductance mechanosensitive channel n=1 Tax=Roseinatronobacter thiooxidans TaxID=121821 RepID=A0A2W7R1K6_9RHOB|nr:DUF3772 domain-containing protein [Roseinatronobacter thiooxidans]PZX44525.1 small-conductance mechanosensitive channel [Roseinatronobacter thiooxidans]